MPESNEPVVVYSGNILDAELVKSFLEAEGVRRQGLWHKRIADTSIRWVNGFKLPQSPIVLFSSL